MTKMNQVEDLVLQYQAKIRAYFFFKTGDKNTASDLVQETFLVVMKKIDTYDKTRPAWPWLLGIAYNLLHEHWRSKKKDSMHISFDMYLDEYREQNQSHEKSQDYQESLIATLKKCVDKLPPKGRELVKMIYEDKNKCTVVATNLKKQVSAIRTAIHRTRLALQKCVESQLGEGLL